MSVSNMVLCRCPKCGNEPEIIINENEVSNRYVVTCTNKNCEYKRKGFGPIKSTAINMWNDRVTIKVYKPSEPVRRF